MNTLWNQMKLKEKNDLAKVLSKEGLGKGEALWGRFEGEMSGEEERMDLSNLIRPLHGSLVSP